MLKPLIKKIRWIVVGFVIFGAIVFVAYQEHTASQKYESKRESRCASVFVLDPEKQDACQHERDSASDYLPWWYVLVIWPDGITTWAIIVTGIVIGWQAWETRKTAEAANRGIELTKTKDRAKLLLSPQALNPVIGAVPEAKLFVTNVGESYAAVGMAISGLEISDSDDLMGNGAGFYGMKIEFRLLESKETIEETVLWAGHPFGRYSPDVIDGKKVIHLRGMIRFKDAFEDTWGVDFHFIWRPYGAPVWFPQLGTHKHGDWDDKDKNGEYRISIGAKPRWWKFWFKTVPRA